jgi:hypothetical protein
MWLEEWSYALLPWCIFVYIIPDRSHGINAFYENKFNIYLGEKYAFLGEKALLYVKPYVKSM